MPKLSFKRFFGMVTSGDSKDNHQDTAYELKNAILEKNMWRTRPGCVKYKGPLNGKINLIYSLKRQLAGTIIDLIGWGGNINAYGPATLTKTGLKDIAQQAAALQDTAFIVNGQDKNISYSGSTAATGFTNMGIEPPPTTAAPTLNALIAGSLVASGTYYAWYEYYNINKAQPSNPSPASAVITVGAGAGQRGIRVDIPANASVDSQVTHVRGYLSTNGDTIAYGGVASETVAYTGAATTIDFTAAEEDRDSVMGELNDTETANVNVHGVPPVVASILSHKGRIFGLGTVPFSTGTVAVTNASTTVTLTGSTLPTGIKGMYFQVANANRKYVIASRTDDTNFELTEAYAETTDGTASYSIAGESSILYFTYIDVYGNSYPESWPDTYWGAVHKDDNDDGVGLGVVGDNVAAFKRKSWGILSGDDPTSFKFTTMSKTRGCAARKSIVTDDVGNVIWTDTSGVYLSNGAGPEQVLSADIANLWTGEGDPPWTIDLTRLSNACATYDKVKRRYRLHLSSSGQTTLDRWIEYDFTLIDGVPAGWSWGAAIDANTAGILEDINGIQYMALGDDGGATGLRGYVYKFDEAYTNDGAGSTSTNRGTVTSADANTLVDTAATFTSDVRGCDVKILSGTGEGQSIRIYSHNAPTFTLTLDTGWTTVPDTTSVYAIGAIDAYRKTQWLDFGVLGWKSVGIIRQYFTQAAYSAYVKIFHDHRTAAILTKTFTLNVVERYAKIKRGANRFRHIMFQWGLDDVDRPVEFRECEVDFEGKGKPSDLQ